MYRLFDLVSPPHALVIFALDHLILLFEEQSYSYGIYGRSTWEFGEFCVLYHFLIPNYRTPSLRPKTDSRSHTPHRLGRDILLQLRMSADNGMPYDLAVQKGHQLASSFSANMPASRWQTVQDLDNLGWAQEYQEPGEENGAPLVQDESKVNMYHDLRLSEHPSYNFNCRMKHMFDNGGFYPTRGFYSCVYNPNAILAHASESPDFLGAQQQFQQHGLPIVPLKHWSDVVFLKWAECCAHWRTPMTGLRAIIQCDVNNKTTERIVCTALERCGMKLQQWPKREWKTGSQQGAATFPIDSPECQAILASPNGVGPVHLLTQHQRQLGKMMVSAVTAFARLSFGANPAPINLVFHVVPVG